MRVYEKVRAYIDEMGYKQVTIAEKAGIPKATFNAILNGKRTLYTESLNSCFVAELVKVGINCILSVLAKKDTLLQINYSI